VELILFFKKSGRGDQNAIKLKIYIPYSDDPETPLDIMVKRECSVEDAIGYTLFEYVALKLGPKIPDDKSSVIMWNMRIVEDDGSIDEDFPGKALSTYIFHPTNESIYTCLNFDSCKQLWTEPETL
jgi:hypothetical protein